MNELLTEVDQQHWFKHVFWTYYYRYVSDICASNR